MPPVYSQDIPTLTTESGAMRRVGVEMEFTGVNLHTVAEVLRNFTGDLSRHSLVVWYAQHPDWGQFELELDWDYLKRLADEQPFSLEEENWANFLQEVAAMVVPIEVVCPPIRVDRLGDLDALVRALHDAGAQGTDDSIFAAYGVHLNVEVPAMKPEVVLGYLKAFCLLQWWLSEAHKVDFTRKITPYVNLYPEAYVRRILETDSADWDGLIRVYTLHNETRNRALDLYPLFAHYDESKVNKAMMRDRKIKKRPAFHYRLPNCEIDRPGWTLAEPWALWCEVERLAYNERALQELTRVYLGKDRALLGVNRRQWTEYIKQWLGDRSSV